MNKRLKSLRRRRELLVLRAATQRDEVSSIGAELNERLWPVDLGIGIAHTLRRRPWWAVAGVAMLVAGGRRNRLLRLGARLFTLWELAAVVRKQVPRRGA
jgi:hypothetical protein